ncbi:hypothetical protein PISMIDRAFT_194436 [Pisolithus microcarpus 441]|uniref:Uncharacterized protein n=1 Tax=Pisolithus microcarpus 441 TaxID=765257 RepID=A0A0C9ZEG5_9AGAM|nr:hypothetical protein PISMIDRAFT_194436 [Pisolithus microcarpus 441]
MTGMTGDGMMPMGRMTSSIGQNTMRSQIIALPHSPAKAPVRGDTMSLMKILDGHLPAHRKQKELASSKVLHSPGQIFPPDGVAGCIQHLTYFCTLSYRHRHSHRPTSPSTFKG